mmetsp:Transcript_27970/g.41235  ORF Transcript_27970/g.41235 Transcript_27970/m.41235 type:complete len:231 (+) Transcript_27970:529-1221(+)
MTNQLILNTCLFPLFIRTRKNIIQVDMMPDRQIFKSVYPFHPRGISSRRRSNTVIENGLLWPIESQSHRHQIRNTTSHTVPSDDDLVIWVSIDLLLHLFLHSVIQISTSDLILSFPKYFVETRVHSHIRVDWIGNRSKFGLIDSYVCNEVIKAVSPSKSRHNVPHITVGNHIGVGLALQIFVKMHCVLRSSRFDVCNIGVGKHSHFNVFRRFFHRYKVVDQCSSGAEGRE